MDTDRIASDYATWLASWSPSKRTVQARSALARKCLRDWGLAGFTSPQIQTWLGTSDFSPWSRSTYYSHLCDLCGYLVAAGHLSENPMEGVRKPKRPKSVPRPLTEVEVERVLNAATGEVREWVVLALLSGLRAHEIAKIAGTDVTQERLYVTGKGEVRAALPTHPDIWTLALEHDERGYWYPGTEDGHISGNNISIRVGKLFRSLGITGSIHRCRHTYGTRLLRRGANIRTVQKLMRHASLATTQIYTDVSDDELRDAIGLLST